MKAERVKTVTYSYKVEMTEEEYEALTFLLKTMREHGTDWTETSLRQFNRRIIGDPDRLVEDKLLEYVDVLVNMWEAS